MRNFDDYLCGFVVFIKYHRWSGLGLAASGRQNSLYSVFMPNLLRLLRQVVHEQIVCCLEKLDVVAIFIIFQTSTASYNG